MGKKLSDVTKDMKVETTEPLTQTELDHYEQVLRVQQLEMNMEQEQLRNQQDMEERPFALALDAIKVLSDLRSTIDFERQENTPLINVLDSKLIELIKVIEVDTEGEGNENN